VRLRLADGRRCPARGFIEFDHVKPFAKRGSADEQNIRLLCRSHNLLHARRCFGSLHIGFAASRLHFCLSQSGRDRADRCDGSVFPPGARRAFARQMRGYET